MNELMKSKAKETDGMNYDHSLIFYSLHKFILSSLLGCRIVRSDDS